MAVKLIKFKRHYIPDFIVETDSGSMSNLDLPESDQIKTIITKANINDQSDYFYEIEYANGDKRKKFDMESCIRKHVITIEGFEAYDIKTGNDLMDKSDYYDFDLLILDLFNKILGSKEEDKKEEKKSEA